MGNKTALSIAKEEFFDSGFDERFELPGIAEKYIVDLGNENFPDEIMAKECLDIFIKTIGYGYIRYSPLEANKKVVEKYIKEHYPELEKDGDCNRYRPINIEEEFIKTFEKKITIIEATSSMNSLDIREQYAKERIKSATHEEAMKKLAKRFLIIPNP